MRLVTWNINGLGALRWPFYIHAHHTHKYPIPEAETQETKKSQTNFPPDDFDFIEEFEEIIPSSSSTSSQSAIVDDLTARDPRAADFPAFPSTKLLLTPCTINDYGEFLDYFNADIICFQEVKIGRSRRDLLTKIAFIRGYEAFFSFCQKRPGYSGVVTYTRKRTACPIAAEEGVSGTLPITNLTSNAPSPAATGIGHNSTLLSRYSSNELRDLDSEGRCVITDHGSFVLFNLYIPNAGEEREDFKIKYLELLKFRTDELSAAGRKIIIVGDLNIAGHRLDHCAPQPYTTDDGSLIPFEESPSRRWFRDQLTEYDDLMRVFYPNQRKAYTCWDVKTDARAGNCGARIDYVMASNSLTQENMFNDCRILPHVRGSDHCPVQCDIDDEIINRSWLCGVRPPSLAACYWSDLSGKQKTLKSFFTANIQQQPETENEENEIIVNNSNVLKPGSPSQTIGTKRKSVGDSIPLASFAANKKKKSSVNAKPLKGKSSLLTYFKPPTSTTTSNDPPVIDQASPIKSEPVTIIEDERKGADENLFMTSNETEQNQMSMPEFSPSSVIDLSDSSPASTSSSSSSWFQRLQLMHGSSLNLNCSVHDLPCKRFTVSKKGPNQGREFYCCSVPLPDRCKFWIWAADARSQQKRKLEFEEKKNSPFKQKEFATARQIIDKNNNR